MVHNKNGQDCQKTVDNLREALQQVIFQNEMMLRWINGAVISVDNNGFVAEVNDVALASLGWERETLIGLSGHKTFQHTTAEGDAYPWEFSPVFAAIEDGSAHHVDGDLFWRKDGSSFIADYIVNPIRDENNEISGATIIFRNLTELRMQEAKKVLSMKLESLGELSAGIAHEINTPIQFIGSNLAFLQEAFDDLLHLVKSYGCLQKALHNRQEIAPLLAQISRQEEEADITYLLEECSLAFDQTLQGVERVTALVLGLKGFAHSSENTEKAPADINEIIRNTLIVSHNAYKYVAECQTSYGEIPQIPVHHGDIGQVILNLIVNAAHAIEEMRENSLEMGIITISTSVEDGWIIISVADNGGGVPDHLRERIFDPFFTTKEVGRGSGQGLAIARNIVHEKHGGELSLQTLDKGSLFTVKLPLQTVP